VASAPEPIIACWTFRSRRRHTDRPDRSSERGHDNHVGKERFTGPQTVGWADAVHSLVTI